MFRINVCGLIGSNLRISLEFDFDERTENRIENIVEKMQQNATGIQSQSNGYDPLNK